MEECEACPGIPAHLVLDLMLVDTILRARPQGPMPTPKDPLASLAAYRHQEVVSRAIFRIKTENPDQTMCPLTQPGAPSTLAIQVAVLGRGLSLLPPPLWSLTAWGQTPVLISEVCAL